MIHFPLSPAWSSSDNMSDEDLDAYFDKLGSLSRLPTPPLREAPLNKVSIEGSRYHDFSYNATTIKNASNALSSISCRTAGGVAASADNIGRYLEAARLHVETIALAHNILSEVRVPTNHKRHDSASPSVADLIAAQADDRSESTPNAKPELFVLASLHIASSYMNGHPMDLSEWSEKVAQNSFPTEDLRQMTSHIMSNLEWHLHTLASPHAIDSLLQTFEGHQCSSAVPDMRSYQPLHASELRLIDKAIPDRASHTLSSCTPLSTYFDL